MIEEIWNKLTTFIEEAFPNTFDSGSELSDYLKEFPFLKLAEQSRIYFSIHKVQDRTLEYRTKNIEEVLGIPEEEFELKGVNAFFEALHPDHVKGVMATFEHLNIFYKTLQERNENSKALVYRCGLKFNHSYKGEIRLLWKSQFFDVLNDYNNPQRAIFIFQDITHLIKNDFFWLRAVHVSNKKAIYMTSKSETEGYSTNDILSDREKEILKLLANGKTTDEIANELYISKVTVNNHRQNMLNKIGAKDVTALIQLAKLTKII